MSLVHRTVMPITMSRRYQQHRGTSTEIVRYALEANRPDLAALIDGDVDWRGPAFARILLTSRNGEVVDYLLSKIPVADVLVHGVGYIINNYNPHTLRICETVLEKDPGQALKSYNNGSHNKWTEDASLRQMFYYMYYKCDASEITKEDLEGLAAVVKGAEMGINPEISGRIDQWVEDFDKWAQGHRWNM